MHTKAFWRDLHHLVVGDYADIHRVSWKLGETDPLEKGLVGILYGLALILVWLFYTAMNLVDLLDLSKVRRGELDVKLQRTALHEVIEEIALTISPLADSKRLRIELPPARSLTVTADPRRLGQVFLNLLSNAIKFNRPGGTVRVETRTKGDRVLILVIDTGVGIPPGDRERIFEEFVQIEDPASRPSYDGTGLGLPISRHLAQLMGGTLTLETQKRGSTFVVDLPVSGDYSSPPKLPGSGRGQIS